MRQWVQQPSLCLWLWTCACWSSRCCNLWPPEELHDSTARMTDSPAIHVTTLFLILVPSLFIYQYQFIPSLFFCSPHFYIYIYILLLEPLPCSFCHDHCQVHFVSEHGCICELPGFMNWDLAWDIGVYIWNLLFLVKSDDKSNCLLQGKWFLTSLDQSPGKCDQKSLQIIICWLGV